jgi:hypothetical protein
LRAYGYDVRGGETLLELQEVTICVDSRQAKALSEFLAGCAREMETNPDWEHRHFDSEAPTQLIIFSAARARHLGASS